jgi:Ca2+-dependent lipid-binding protein
MVFFIVIKLVSFLIFILLILFYLGESSFLQMHAVGELDIKLIEGKNLKKTDLVGKTDPFVVMYVRQTKDKMKRSTKKKNTLNPVWNENFKVEVKHQIASRLYFSTRYFDSGLVSVEVWEAINLE